MSKYLNKVLKIRQKMTTGFFKSDGSSTVLREETLKELGEKHYPTHTAKKETACPNISITKVELESSYKTG